MRIVFLVSGNGSHLKFLDQAIRRGLVENHEIVGVVADRKCPAYDYASKSEISSQIVEYSRERPEALQAALQSFAPDLVITNIHKILDAQTDA